MTPDSRSGLILLTGATGFVGRQVLDELCGRGARIRPVVRDGKQGQIPASPAIESIVTTADLWAETIGWWAEACRGVDTVIHVAWYAEPGQYLQSIKNLECLSGTLQLAQGAARAKVRRFVGVGHLEVKTPLKPTTLYAAAKAAAFMTLAQYLPQQGIEFAWCRLFYLYGEGEDARRLVPYLRAKLAAGEPAELTSGNQLRDYLDVREAARQLADAALGRVQGPVNICSGEGVTIRALAERIADEYGRRDLLRFGARPDNLVDPPVVVGVR